MTVIIKERGALTKAAENTTIIIQEKGIETTGMMVAILMQGGLTIVKKATIKVTTEGILLQRENVQGREVFITMTVITKTENAVLKEA